MSSDDLLRRIARRRQLPLTVTGQLELVGVQPLQAAAVPDADDRALGQPLRTCSYMACSMPSSMAEVDSSRKISDGLAQQDPAEREPLLLTGRQRPRPVPFEVEVVDRDAPAGPCSQHRPGLVVVELGGRGRVGQGGPQRCPAAGTAAGSRTGSPSSSGRSTVPSACGQSPAMLRSRVVLPVPDGPVINRVLPSSTSELQVAEQRPTVGQPRPARSRTASPLGRSSVVGVGSARASSLTSSSPVSRSSTAR